VISRLAGFSASAELLVGVADITGRKTAVLRCSGITPIGQGWTNARVLRGLGGLKPDDLFVYFNISSVRCQPSTLLYS